jgi:hypothetical protein
MSSSSVEEVYSVKDLMMGCVDVRSVAVGYYVEDRDMCEGGVKEAEEEEEDVVVRRREGRDEVWREWIWGDE